MKLATHTLLPLSLATLVALATGADAAVAGAVAPPAAAEGGAAVRQSAAVAGKVISEARPLGTAKVYVYRLSDLSLHQAVTDERGGFLFDELPAGLYKIIAHKAGFAPAVVRLTRATADAYQFLELELARESETAAGRADDFWSLRAEVPPDVLREIQVAEIEDSARLAGGPGAGVLATGLAPSDHPARLLAEMRAMTGVDQGDGSGSSQVTQGAVGLEGRFGGMRLGIEGDYWQLQPVDETGPEGRGTASGEASALSLELASENDTRVRLTSLSNRLIDVRNTVEQPVDFEHYRLSVSHSMGEHGRSDFSAQYTSETNYYRHAWADPLEIPEASRSWRLEGTYTTELNERSSLQTGLRYREQEAAFALTDTGLPMPLAYDQQQVDLFGRAGSQIQPSVLVEYGLYSSLRDGSLSLSPRGGLVVQLGPEWQASAAASHKVRDERPADYRRFTAAQSNPIVGDDACEQVQEACYQLTLSHQTSEDNELSVSASRREFDETERLYFSDDLAERFESLYLVPGDALPELQVTMSRRITPKVLARLESSLAEGGGGVFYATDSEAYENQVRYLVTSLDTHFDGTSTGLFIAFHHLQQDLQAVDPRHDRQIPQLAVDRLELMLTQDLNILLDMATDMSLQLNMQLSRGTWPWAGEDSQDELRRRLLGGIAVRF